MRRVAKVAELPETTDVQKIVALALVAFVTFFIATFGSFGVVQLLGDLHLGEFLLSLVVLIVWFNLFLGPFLFLFFRKDEVNRFLGREWFRCR